jgi:hypothetical protein
MTIRPVAAHAQAIHSENAARSTMPSTWATFEPSSIERRAPSRRSRRGRKPTCEPWCEMSLHNVAPVHAVADLLPLNAFAVVVAHAGAAVGEVDEVAGQAQQTRTWLGRDGPGGPFADRPCGP